MYSFLCAPGQRCLDLNCILWSWQLDLFWNTIIFVLLRLNVRAQVCQNLGAAVGPPWLETEAPDHQQTVDIWLQILVGWGQVLQTILVPTPIRWNICWRGWGLIKLHVCLTPQPSGKKLLVCVHGFYNIVCFSPNTTFHQFVWQTLMPNWVKGFFEINKAWEDFAFVLVCLFQLGCAGWICGLSYGHLVKSQFDIFSVHCLHWGNVRVCC